MKRAQNVGSCERMLRARILSQQPGNPVEPWRRARARSLYSKLFEYHPVIEGFVQGRKGWKNSRSPTFPFPCCKRTKIWYFSFSPSFFFSLFHCFQSVTFCRDGHFFSNVFDAKIRLNARGEKPVLERSNLWIHSLRFRPRKWSERTCENVFLY